jgi:subtilisin-like proprotein convertase family protein
MRNEVLVVISTSLISLVANASPSGDVQLSTSGVCNQVYTWWVVKNTNQNKSIEVNVEIEKEVRGSLTTSEQQVLLAPGGSKQIICNGAIGSYTAKVRKLGAVYK